MKSTALLIGSALGFLLLTNLANAEDDLSVESRASWMTPLQPEGSLTTQESITKGAGIFCVFR